MRKYIVRIAGHQSAVLTFNSFVELKKRCSSNGQNLDPKKHFKHVCKPSVCTNWFSQTNKCKQTDCPLRAL